MNYLVTLPNVSKDITQRKYYYIHCRNMLIIVKTELFSLNVSNKKLHIFACDRSGQNPRKTVEKLKNHSIDIKLVVEMIFFFFFTNLNTLSRLYSNDKSLSVFFKYENITDRLCLIYFWTCLISNRR